MCTENIEIAARKASNEHLTWEDLRKMTISWRVVQETMRLTPAANAMMRTASHEMSFNGFQIPKSWKVRETALTEIKQTKKRTV
jgi:(+)-abscisic acid 8'-hydroxylase